MPSEASNNKLRFSLAHLKQKADTLLMLIDRDIAEFANRGMTPARRNAYLAAIDAFENTPADDTLRTFWQEKAAIKTAARATVLSEAGFVFIAAKRTFRHGNACYKSFGKPALSRLSDEQLYRNTKTTIAAATDNLAALATEGVTAAQIATLTDANNALDAAIDAQTWAAHTRDISTEDRAGAAQALYNLIVNYSETGRSIWQDTSEARYNDYVVHDTRNGAAKATAPGPDV